MNLPRCLIKVCLLCIVVFGVFRVAADEKLAVCLDSDNVPFSYKYGKREGGVDLDLVQELARRLNLQLQIVWFEIEDDEEVVRTRQINALFGAGICELVPGYAFLETELAAPSTNVSTLPDLEGPQARRFARGRMFAYEPIVWSPPYFSVRWGFAARENSQAVRIESANEAMQYSVGAVMNSIPTAYLSSHFGARAYRNTRHKHNPKELLQALAEQEIELAFVERYHVDHYVHRNPQTGIVWTDTELVAAVDFVMISLASQPERNEAIHRGLQQMIDDGAVARAFSDNGLHYYEALSVRPLPTAELMQKLGMR